MGYMGGCQNHGPFLGTLNIKVPYCNRGPKRDHNFDNSRFGYCGAPNPKLALLEPAGLRSAKLL